MSKKCKWKKKSNSFSMETTKAVDAEDDDDDDDDVKNTELR